MATSITQQPATLGLCRSPIIVSVYDVLATNPSYTNFEYVLDVYIWHGAEASTPVSYSYRLAKPPLSDGRASFDLKDLVAAEIEQLENINTISAITSGGETAVNVLVKVGYRSDGGDSLANTTGSRFTCIYGYTYFSEGINAQKLESDGQYVLTDRSQDIYISSSKKYAIPLFADSANDVAELKIIDYTGSDERTTISSSPSSSDDRIRYIPIDPTFIASQTSLDVSRDYTIQFVDVSDDIRAQYKVHLICEPKYTTHTIFFVNRYGVWDFIECFKRSNSSISVTKKDYQSSIASIQSGAVTYNTEHHNIKDFNVDGTSSLTLNTGFQGEGLKVLIEQLLLSEQILIDNGANLLPYRISDTTKDLLKSVNDGNINYTLSFNAAFNIINSIR